MCVACSLFEHTQTRCNICNLHAFFLYMDNRLVIILLTFSELTVKIKLCAPCTGCRSCVQCNAAVYYTIYNWFDSRRFNGHVERYTIIDIHSFLIKIAMRGRDMTVYVRPYNTEHCHGILAQLVTCKKNRPYPRAGYYTLHTRIDYSVSVIK